MAVNTNKLSDAYIYPFAVVANGEPINFPNTICMIYIAEQVEKMGIKYLVNGEGADEIFGGYKFYLEEPNVFNSAYNMEGMVCSVVNFDKLKIGMEWRSWMFKNLFSGVNREIYYNMNTYLFPVVNRLMRGLSYGGIVPISPFFDLEMFQFSMSLPDRLKVNAGLTTKYIIKKLAEKYFNQSFVYRDKIGFSVPIDDWLSNSNGLLAYTEILAEDRTQDRDFMRINGVRNLLRKFALGKRKSPILT